MPRSRNSSPVADVERPRPKAPRLSRAKAIKKVEAAFQRHKKGDLKFAYKVYAEVLKQFPELANALHYLGLIAQQTGRPNDAIQLLRRSIASDGSDPRTYNHLGQVYLYLKDRQRAKQYFEEALRADPAHEDSLNNLANILKAEGDIEAAVGLYRKIQGKNSKSALAKYNLANALKELHEYDDAIAMYKEAVSVEPVNYMAHFNLAVSLEEKGRFKEAVQHYEEAIAVNPRHAKSIGNLLAIRSYAPPEKLVNAAMALAKAASTEREDRIKLHNALGKHYDRKARFDDAFSNFKQANALRRANQPPYDHLKTVAYFDRIIATFTEENLARHRSGANNTESVIFIVGLPRSGTTLTEQILASHPRVFGAGERQDIIEIVRKLHPRYPQCVATMEPARISRYADEYLSRGQRLSAKADMLLTDKLPINFVHLGLITTLFPNARIVHCHRNPLDVGLSCFIEQFEMPQDFTTDLSDFGAYYGQYDRLMKHWRRVLRAPFHEVRYEDLVESPEAESKKLIRFCGLDWDEKCLHFHDANRSVMTPSRWQVRQPIYKSSKERWRNYRAHLEPLRRRLEIAAINVGSAQTAQ